MHGDNIEQTEIQTSGFADILDRTNEILCDIRQWRFPEEFRIAKPLAVTARGNRAKSSEWGDSGDMASSVKQCKQATPMDRSIAEVAVCLWDIRRKLQGSEAAQQDRKLRLLNRRAEKAISALEEAGVVIDDPIGRRYAAGSEGSMKPNFQPTPGATYEKVIETITPIVYRDERLIGRGEVFVAVPAPAGQETKPAESVIGTPATNGRDEDAAEPTGNDTPRANGAAARQAQAPADQSSATPPSSSDGSATAPR